jgi:linear primary-alkylsulfatase
MPNRTALVAAAIIAIATGCAERTVPVQKGADQAGFTAPTSHTVAANQAVLETRPFGNQQDFADASRGLIARMDTLQTPKAGGGFIWNMDEYAFMQGEAPASVNPSLWRQATLNNQHGLYKVSDGIYQLRGHDLANMTLIEGSSGWIVVDPLTANETTAVAMELVRQNLGDKPISAVLFTHSHIDHFGGVLGLMSREQAASQNLMVVAPKGFMHEVTSENIIAGIAMGRRSQYMYGTNLPRSPRGHVGSGLGKTPAIGTPSVLQPTVLIDANTREMVIDGVTFDFLYTPESEAPAEFVFYLPEHKAFCGAEVVSNNLHNLYTLRGAKVRDAQKWSAYIDQSLQRYGNAEVYFGSHHWPKWGNQQIRDFLEVQRDTYKFIHDQTVRWFNAGYTPLEIAERIKLPDSLRQGFSNSDYYGTVRHNSRAVYQAYLGWYDANPAHLNPLPPIETGHRYVQAMGGSTAVIATAQQAFDEGDYRWSAELLNHLVFAEPKNVEARALLAASYDQMGYQAESGPWRDAYLSAAYELRYNKPPEPTMKASVMKNILQETPLPLMLNSMTVRLNAQKAEGVDLKVVIAFTDVNESYLLSVKNSVMHQRPTRPGDQPDATLRLTTDLFMQIALKEGSLTDTLLSDDLSLEGSKLDLVRFFGLLDNPDGNFDIVLPGEA